MTGFVLVSGNDAHLILTDFFRGLTEREIEAWASRRGFGLRLVPAAQAGIADLVVDRPGPHFIPRVIKSWFQSKEIRCTEVRQGSPLIRQIMDLNIDTYPIEGFIPRIWELRTNLTVYDAWYVALAEALEISLVTTDHRLAGAPGITCDVELVD